MNAPSPVEDWLRIHRLLIEEEAAFTDLALRAAAGEISLQELDRHREALMGLRDLCTSVYDKAFGDDSRPTRPPSSPRPIDPDA